MSVSFARLYLKGSYTYLITYKQYIFTNVHIKNLTQCTIDEVVQLIYVGFTE